MSGFTYDLHIRWSRVCLATLRGTLTDTRNLQVDLGGPNRPPPKLWAESVKAIFPTRCWNVLEYFSAWVKRENVQYTHQLHQCDTVMTMIWYYCNKYIMCVQWMSLHVAANFIIWFLIGWPPHEVTVTLSPMSQWHMSSYSSQNDILSSYPMSQWHMVLLPMSQWHMVLLPMSQWHILRNYGPRCLFSLLQNG